MPVEQLSADDFDELLNKNKKVNLLDVREKIEYDQGHIEGARLIPATRFKENFEKLKIKKPEKIALYCQTGSRSDFIGRQLLSDGYENIYNLEMGIEEWLDYGKKLVKK